MNAHSLDSPEGQANVQRACTLVPGDVIRAFGPRGQLLLILQPKESVYTSLEAMNLFMDAGRPAGHRCNYYLHDDWELVGHADNWKAIVKSYKKGIEPCKPDGNT